MNDLNSKNSINSDCKILFKKQNLQYKLAVREGKANQRRKKQTQRENNAGVEKPDMNTIHTIPTMAYIGNVVLHDAPSVYFPLTTKIVELSSSNSSDLQNPTSLYHTNANAQLKQQREEKSGPESPVIKITTPAKFTSDGLAFMLIGAAGMTGIGLLKIFEHKAKQLSHWAKRNPWKTRSTLGGMQLAMAATSIWLGNYLYEEGMMIPEYARLTGMGLFAGAAIFYPSKFYSNGFPSFSYMRRKLHDVGLVTAGAILTVYAGNHYTILVRPSYPVHQVFNVAAPTEKIASVPFLKSKISLVKREFKERIETYLQDPKKERTRGEKIALTIVAALGFAILSFGVAALSCNIACSGNEAAAVAVAVAGAGLIAWGLTAAIKSIHNYSKKEKTKLQPSS